MTAPTLLKRDDTGFDLGPWMGAQLARVEQALDQWVAPADSVPSALAQPMRYAVLDGGKRMRPLLVLAASEAAGGQGQAALRAACAVEMIHAYSLVHDDMPCMDNDVLRRGKATVHVQFGQASALLAGDALQALAFEVLAPEDGSVSLALQGRLCGMLARAAGGRGMAGGQAIDLASVGRSIDSEQLHEMHRLKTGALLQASVLMGAACGSADSVAMAHLADYGASIGLAFQVVDDILDVTADSKTLGKTAGKDAEQDKPTFVSLMGLRESRDYAQALLTQAHNSLRGSGLRNTAALGALADKLVHRAF